MNTSLFLLAAVFVVTMVQCLRPLGQFESVAHVLHLAEFETSEALDYVCERMHSAKDCVVNVHEVCGQENMYAQIMRETVEGVVNHLCSDEGKDVILTETDCWVNHDVEEVFQDCHEDNDNNNPCEMISDMRTCVRNEVKELCNERAANFVDDLLYYFIEPMASELIGCDMQLRFSRSIMKLLSLKHKKK